MTNETTNTTTKTKPAPDREACKAAFAALSDVLLAHPIVRSFAVAVDFEGDINNIAENHAVWVGVDADGKVGPVIEAPAILGSLFQTVRLLEEQFSRANLLYKQWETSAINLGKELATKYEELQTLERRVASLKSQLCQETGPGGA